MSKRKNEETLDIKALRKQMKHLEEQFSYLGKKEDESEDEESDSSMRGEDQTSEGLGFYEKDYVFESDEHDEEGSEEEKENIQEIQEGTMGDDETVKEAPLDDEVIEVLGEDPLTSKALKLNLHSSIHKRWQFWFQNGIERQERENLLEKYGSPAGLTAPKLNPEIALKLQAHSKTRDTLMCKRQQLAGAALNAIGAVLTTLIEEKKNIDRRDCLEKLHDAGKLTVELMNSQTKSRRALILAGVDKDTRGTLEGTKSDVLLFGEKLGERIKEARNLEKVANALRKQSDRRLPLVPRQALNSRGLQGGKPSPYQTGRQQGYNPGKPRSRLSFKINPRNQPFNHRAQFQGHSKIRAHGRRN